MKDERDFRLLKCSLLRSETELGYEGIFTVTNTLLGRSRDFPFTFEGDRLVLRRGVESFIEIENVKNLAPGFIERVGWGRALLVSMFGATFHEREKRHSSIVMPEMPEECYDEAVAQLFGFWD